MAAATQDGTITVGAGGIGSGFVTIWFWNSVLVPKWGVPEIPAEVAAALAPMLVMVAAYFVDIVVRLNEWLLAWLPKRPVPPTPAAPEA